MTAKLAEYPIRFKGVNDLEHRLDVHGTFIGIRVIEQFEATAKFTAYGDGQPVLSGRLSSGDRFHTAGNRFTHIIFEMVPDERANAPRLAIDAMIGDGEYKTDAFEFADNRVRVVNAADEPVPVERTDLDRNAPQHIDNGLLKRSYAGAVGQLVDENLIKPFSAAFATPANMFIVGQTYTHSVVVGTLWNVRLDNDGVLSPHRIIKVNRVVVDLRQEALEQSGDDFNADTGSLFLSSTVSNGNVAGVTLTGGFDADYREAANLLPAADYHDGANMHKWLGQRRTVGGRGIQINRMLGASNAAPAGADADSIYLRCNMVCGYDQRGEVGIDSTANYGFASRSLLPSANDGDPLVRFPFDVAHLPVYIGAATQ